MTASQHEIVDLLRTSRTIAVVGLSPKEDRPSFRVAAYLKAKGYRIIPVRPGGGEVLGEPCHVTLDDIPREVRVDIVDVFRAAAETPPVAEAAVRIGARALWLQSGILNEEAMAIAARGGLLAIEDLCLMVEHRNLIG